jgi:hypothetical protein
MILTSIQRQKIGLTSWKGHYDGGIWHQLHLIPLVYMLNLYLLGIHNLCHFPLSSENHGMVEQIVNVRCILAAASKEI